jgi:hypothetical protein
MDAALRLVKNKGLIPFPPVLSPVKDVSTSEFQRRGGSFTHVRLDTRGRRQHHFNYVVRKKDVSTKVKKIVTRNQGFIKVLFCDVMDWSFTSRRWRRHKHKGEGRASPTKIRLLVCSTARVVTLHIVVVLTSTLRGLCWSIGV